MKILKESNLTKFSNGHDCSEFKEYLRNLNNSDVVQIASTRWRSDAEEISTLKCDGIILMKENSELETTTVEELLERLDNCSDTEPVLISSNSRGAKAELVLNDSFIIMSERV